MHVFVTGVSGFIGSETIPALIQRGHTVTGLVRSDSSASKVQALGATPVKGSLEDLDVLAREVAMADGVIHLAFNHDATDFAQTIAADLAALAALGDALVGSNKVLLGCSGAFTVAGHSPATEDTRGANNPRVPAEELVLSYAEQGVRAALLRLAPICHGRGDKGFLAMLLNGAVRAGTLTYVGDGQNRWPACHRDDVAELFVLALEQAQARAVYHAVAEEGLPVKTILEACAEGTGLRVESGKSRPEDGFVGMFLGTDCFVSSEKTRKELGWEPKGITLLEDIAEGHYFEGLKK